MTSSLRRYTLSLFPHALAGAALAGLFMVWLMNESPVSGFKLAFVLLYLWIIFSLAAYFAWKVLLAPRLNGIPLRSRLFWLAGCQLVGFWLADNIPVVLPGGGAVKMVYFLAAGAGTGLLLFGLTVLLANRDPAADPPASRRLGWLVFALPMLASWTVYLLAFWPGMMSADSLDQWGQVLSGQFTDHHPAFHTFILWLLTRFVQSPAIVALAQIVALALVAGAILSALESHGVDSRWVWAGSLIFALSPVNGTMVITLWKDIPYSTAMLGVSFLLFQLGYSRGRWIEKPAHWILLGTTAALAALFRHNGLQVMVVVFVITLVVLRGYWKPLAAAFGLSMGLYFTITGPGYDLARVERSSLLMDSATSVYTIAATADPGSQAESVLESMNPLSNTWTCDVLSSLYQANDSDPPGHAENLVEKAQNLVEFGPTLAAYDYRCNRALVWIIWDPNGELRNPSHAGYWIDPNPFGIEPDSKLPALQSLVTDFVTHTAYNPEINWLVWRPALYLYLFLLVVVIAALRQKNAWLLLAAAPILIQSLSFILISSAPNFRYHYLAYLLALAFWPLFFIPSAGPQPGVPPGDAI